MTRYDHSEMNRIVMRARAALDRGDYQEAHRIFWEADPDGMDEIHRILQPLARSRHTFEYESVDLSEGCDVRGDFRVIEKDESA